MAEFRSVEGAYSREEALEHVARGNGKGVRGGGDQGVAVLAPRRRSPWGSHGTGNTYPVVGSASYSSLQSRRLPSVAPPTHDTTFNPHTPPMASYYYHCARAACPFYLLPSSTSPGCSTSSTVESRRSHCMRPFVESHRPRSKTVRCVNTRGCFEAGAGYVFRFISAARVVDHRTRGTAGTTCVLMRWQVLFYILYIYRRWKNIGAFPLEFFGKHPIF